MHVVDGQNVQLPRTVYIRPEKKPVRGVIQRTALLGGIRDVCTVNQRPTLGAPSALHVDSPIRTSNNSGNERKQRLESLICVGRILNRLLFNRCGNAGDIGGYSDIRGCPGYLQSERNISNLSRSYTHRLLCFKTWSSSSNDVSARTN